jgi:arabinose-5-phosphate isomerase
MERRNFTKEQYRTFHPGGSLGKKLFRVSDLMHGGEEVPLVRIGASMTEVLLEMTRGRFGCVGVTNAEGGLVGIFTAGDLSRSIDARLLDRRIDDVMTKTPKTLAPEQLAAEAVAVMNQAKITVLFVVASGDSARRPVGILSMHDCLKAGL